jgi:hypothetical protein
VSSFILAKIYDSDLQQKKSLLCMPVECQRKNCMASMNEQLCLHCSAIPAKENVLNNLHKRLSDTQCKFSANFISPKIEGYFFLNAKNFRQKGELVEAIRCFFKPLLKG